MNKTNINFGNKQMLKMIRSKYIVIKIFDNLEKDKLLNVIRYNKKYQKLMDKTLNDYIEEFLIIKIEIIPKENLFGKFIKLSSDAKIYFNDNKEEIKRNFITKDDNVSKIKIIINQNIKYLSKLFCYCKCIKKINYIRLRREDIYDMSEMFFGCSSLEEINFSNFNTNNVANMSHMFFNCPSLKELNVSNFSTSNVTNMSYMFTYCSSLKELNVSNFNTNNVIDMSQMFSKCK